ncbi:hypothetical protein C8R47DRAFT_1295073 [Mycena vitilis]|nr:hypothetical protein C8R47DRAFT_1295073 [Mycena vitilis]
MGFHRFVMNLDPTPLLDGSVGGPMAFDYALYYTSNDPDLGSGSPSSTALPSPSHPSRPSKTAPVGAIVGAVVGALLLLAFIFAFLWSLQRVVQRARKKRRNSPGMEESGQLATDALVVSKEVLPPATPPSDPVEASMIDNTGSPFIDTLDTAHVPPPLVEPPPSDPMPSVAAQDEVRILREQLEQSKQRVDGGSATAMGQKNASLGRSLSTMKREQTRVLQPQLGPGNYVTDTLFHTDSGLRLTAGRAVDELPPSYVAD